MELQLQNLKSSASGGSVQVSADTFDRPYNESLVHQVVTAYLAGGRAGTHAQKTRAQVRGGGIKPWRQKGTGRARAGTIRSPIWRTGGKTFAAVTADYSQKVNKKMYRAAMQVIVSQLVRQERLIVVETIAIAAPKTRELLDVLRGMDLNNVLIVTDAVDQNLYLAARNLYRVAVCDVAQIDPVSLVGFEKVLMTVNAVKKLEEAFA